MSKKRKITPPVEVEVVEAEQVVPEVQLEEARQPELEAEARELGQEHASVEPEQPTAEPGETVLESYETLAETAPYPREIVELTQVHDPAHDLAMKDEHIRKLIERNVKLEEQIENLVESREAEIARRCAERAVKYAETTEALMNQIVQLRESIQTRSLRESSQTLVPFLPVQEAAAQLPTVGDPSDNYREDRE